MFSLLNASDLYSHSRTLPTTKLSISFPEVRPFIDNSPLADINGCGLAFADDSELLKHELAYCLGQIGNPRANPTLEKVLEDLNEAEMVRHEVTFPKYMGGMG